MRNIYYITIAVAMLVLSVWYDFNENQVHYTAAGMFLLGALFEIKNYLSKQALCFMWAGPFNYSKENQSIRFAVLVLWILIAITCMVYLIIKWKYL